LGYVGGVGLEDVGPDDGVAVQDGGAVRAAVVDVRVAGGFEGGEAGLPGRVDVVSGEAAVEGGLADLGAEVAEVVEGGGAGVRLGGGELELAVFILGELAMSIACLVPKQPALPPRESRRIAICLRMDRRALRSRRWVART